MPRTNPARYSDPLRGTRTRQEAARLIGCGVVKVDQLIDRGSLDAILVGNRRLVPVPALERLLGRPITEMEAPLRPPAPAQHETAAPPPPARVAAAKE
jgi:excisionase family DNA binding protein